MLAVLFSKKVKSAVDFCSHENICIKGTLSWALAITLDYWSIRLCALECGLSMWAARNLVKLEGVNFRAGASLSPW